MAYTGGYYVRYMSVCLCIRPLVVLAPAVVEYVVDPIQERENDGASRERERERKGVSASYAMLHMPGIQYSGVVWILLLLLSLSTTAAWIDEAQQK